MNWRNIGVSATSLEKKSETSKTEATKTIIPASSRIEVTGNLGIIYLNDLVDFCTTVGGEACSDCRVSVNPDSLRHV